MRKSGCTLTELSVLIAIIAIIIFMGGCIKGCVENVGDKGLKNVLSDAWNGKGAQQ